MPLGLGLSIGNQGGEFVPAPAPPGSPDTYLRPGNEAILRPDGTSPYLRP